MRSKDIVPRVHVPSIYQINPCRRPAHEVDSRNRDAGTNSRENGRVAATAFSPEQTASENHSWLEQSAISCSDDIVAPSLFASKRPKSQNPFHAMLLTL